MNILREEHQNLRVIMYFAIKNFGVSMIFCTKKFAGYKNFWIDFHFNILLNHILFTYIWQRRLLKMPISLPNLIFFLHIWQKSCNFASNYYNDRTDTLYGGALESDI